MCVLWWSDWTIIVLLAGSSTTLADRTCETPSGQCISQAATLHEHLLEGATEGDSRGERRRQLAVAWCAHAGGDSNPGLPYILPALRWPHIKGDMCKHGNRSAGGAASAS